MTTSHGPSEANISRLAARIPPGTWDTHMHCVDLERFTIAQRGQYEPASHTILEAQTALSRLGIKNMVIVQPSFYGFDNSCTLDGLAHIGGPSHGRAVIQFDPSTTSHAQLRAWHDLGVRGVRVNFKSVGATLESISLAAQLRSYAAAIRPLRSWVLQLYIGMEDLPLLEPLVPELTEAGGLKLCIDHFGHPSSASLSTAQSAAVLPGFASLLNLLQTGHVWVKVSAAYRLDRDPKHPLVRSLTREILRSRPDRCVFATDWPHTRFEEYDVTEYLHELFDSCEAESVDVRSICVENPKVLFDIA